MSTNMLKMFLHKLSGAKDVRAESPVVTKGNPTVARFRVLNVGGASKQIPIPAYFNGWEHLLLDVDPRGSPDIVCDARLLTTLPAGQFDAIYCSHNLEH